MTLGTSPHPLGAALDHGAEAEARVRMAHVRATWAIAATRGRDVLTSGLSVFTTYRVRVLRVLAGVYLLALAAVLASSWGLAGVGDTLHMGQVHLAFLMLAGAGMAVASLNPQRLLPAAVSQAPQETRGDLTGLGDILAQMSHELRTPLNAVIGFSEVMRHELHGPLNERYQEYAIHICESGDRMLKSSQDALAVAEAMTVLLAKTPHLPKERVNASDLLEEAWRTVGGTATDRVSAGPACTMLVERRATTQALEHILREAVSRADVPSGVEAFMRTNAEGPSIKIRAQARVPNTAAGMTGVVPAYPLANSGGLNLLLARLLIEAQGGTFRCGVDDDGAWSVEITFCAA